MEKIELWLPLNGDINLIKRYKNTDVIGFYGSCSEISPSARESRVLKTNYRPHFFDCVYEVHRAGMLFNYTYNSVVDLDTSQMMAIIEDISALRPDRITFASPQPLILAQDMNPKPDFEVSTVAEIINAGQCVEWEKLGASMFTLSSRLSRFPAIIAKDFAKYTVKILVNEICNLNCIFRQTHYINQARDIVYTKYPHNHCQKLMKQNWPEQMLKNNWVLPSQLKNYSDNVEFKIAGRTQTSVKIAQWADYYLAEKDPQDIMDLLPWGKAAGDETVHAGVKPVEGVQPELRRDKIDPAFFEYFKKATTPCYVRDCGKCGKCRKVAEGILNDSYLFASI